MAATHAAGAFTCGAPRRAAEGASCVERLALARITRCCQKRRRNPLPPAPATANDLPQRHFLRPSLLATGLTEPQHVLQHCLALFRKADLAALQQYLPGGAAASVAPASLPVGPLLVAEQGPLASLDGVLDVGARRVLPGHLLRRSEVKSSLQLSTDTFQQRVALTAKSGETSLFEWLLRWQPGQQRDCARATSGLQPGSSSGRGEGGTAASASSNSSSSAPASPSAELTSSVGGGTAGGSGRWVLESVRRDPSTDLPLPTTPHPQAAPEAIAKAQLATLQQGDVLGASCFSMWQARNLSSRKTSLGSHHEALRSQLQQEPYMRLLGHASAHLGSAVLPRQHEMLLQVTVLAADGTETDYVWRLNLATNGCWMVSGIFAAEELGLGGQQSQQPDGV